MEFDIQNTAPTYHDLKKMKQIHHEIAMLAITGTRKNDIARKLDVTPAMVRYTLESTIVKKKLAILRGERDKRAIDVSTRLKELAPLSLDELENLLLHPNTGENTRRMVAQDLLDRAGYSAVQKHADVTEKLTTEDINEIKNIARENGMVLSEKPEPEEAEYTDITKEDDNG